jgi:hypothetical protein
MAVHSKVENIMKKYIDGIEFEMTQEEVDAVAALHQSFLVSDTRDTRNAKLAATDWSQGADVPQAIKDKYVAYRQALRDVPSQAGFPWTITWPEQPA